MRFFGSKPFRKEVNSYILEVSYGGKLVETEEILWRSSSSLK